MERAVIVSALRTPVGRFLGGLSTLSAPGLGAEVVRATLSRTKVDPERVDEVIMGNVLQAGLGQNPARQAAIHGGVSPTAGALTVNKVCGSGLKAVMLAAQAIRLGDAEIVIAGGMESMSRAPYLLPQARTGQRLGHGQMIDAMVHDGLWDCYKDYHMGNTGELVAKEYKVTRADQDQFALASQQKAVAAIDGGHFRDEIVPVAIPQRKGEPLVVDTDEGPRREATLERLAKLKPAFQKDGTVTAGNASTINDGAAATLVTSERKAAELGLPVLAVIEAYATGGMEPQWVMMAPKEAIRKLLAKTGEKLDDFGLIELNEAFSAQGVALTRVLEIDPARLNVNGGAVAIGHPIGCSGTRVLVTLIHAMHKRKVKKGLASLCLGGGNAVAMSVSLP
jgi:acetyl-CoA C-acetyltransferase